MKHRVLKVHPKDNVIVALDNLDINETLTFEGTTYTFPQAVSAKHKFAETALNAGDEIIMYGVLVGKANVAIPKGGLLTIDNITHAAQDYQAPTGNLSWDAPDVSVWQNKTFDGYLRSNGSVGTQNVWLVVPLVFCENRNLKMIQESMVRELGYGKSDIYRAQVKDLIAFYKTGKTIDELSAWTPDVNADPSHQERLFPNVDGVKFLFHEGGCGGTREDSDALCALLAGYITHPNVAGATVLSLGCQHAQVDILKSAIQERDANFDKPLYVFEQQDIKSERGLVEAAIKQTFIGLVGANECKRTPQPLSKLIVGMECGGSDGFSGISANPAIGQAADYLVGLGSSVILSEFPELCGVEQELINRCVNEDTANRFLEIQRAYEKRAEAVGAGFDMNPSPGNIKDGLITDAIKSAGAAKKGGTSPVTGVLDYTQRVRESGLNLLCTPGNDVESTTGLAGSWANLIMFSTGLGTPTGNPVCPVIKVASNTTLAQSIPDIIDVDSGPIITGEKSIEDVGSELIDYAIDVASGKTQTAAMRLGQDDFIPWKRGVSL